MTSTAILIGSVHSSKLILNEMMKCKFDLRMVFALDEKYSSNVSGYVPLANLAKYYDIPHITFKNINDSINIKKIESINPDYIFVVGLSQLVGKEIIKLSKKGTIGYHPTDLPKYRGRAALPWQILLEVKESKCSLFFIDEGMDSGPIIAQENYTIKKDDYVSDVMDSTRQAFRNLLRKTLPKLKKDDIHPVVQNEKDATYLLKRTPEDGRINWEHTINDIHKLVRATSKPFPGAFTYYKGKNKMIIWKALKIKNNKYIGIPGQIAQINESYMDIVCIDGILRIFEYDNVDNESFKVGNKFI